MNDVLILMITIFIYFFQERFATQVIDHPFDERQKEDHGNSYHRPEISAAASPRPVANLRDSISNSHVDYSPETASSLHNSRLESSPLVTKSNELSRVGASPSREADPAPNVGLIIGSEPDPVSF